MAEALSICIRFSLYLLRREGRKLQNKGNYQGMLLKFQASGSPGLPPKQNDSDGSGRKVAVGPETVAVTRRGSCTDLELLARGMGGSLVIRLRQLVLPGGRAKLANYLQRISFSFSFF